MGPLLFRAEDSERRSSGVSAWDCFNGAALVQSGRRPAANPRRTTRPSFNGAALVQSGRLAKLDSVQVRQTSFNGAALVQSGRRAEEARYSKLIQELQWGRSCSERKTGCPAPPRARRCTASMGPLLFRAEDSYQESGEFRGQSALQWGRSCSERKTCCRLLTVQQLPSPLQWGRSCSERKTW